MLLSNIQDNIVKAPIFVTSVAAAVEKARLEVMEHQDETKEQVRQAEESVNELKKSEHEGIRREASGAAEETKEKGGRKHRKRATSSTSEGDRPLRIDPMANRPIAPAPPPPEDGHPHIDITI